MHIPINWRSLVLSRTVRAGFFTSVVRKCSLRIFASVRQTKFPCRSCFAQKRILAFIDFYLTTVITYILKNQRLSTFVILSLNRWQFVIESLGAPKFDSARTLRRHILSCCMLRMCIFVSRLLYRYIFVSIDWFLGVDITKQYERKKWKRSQDNANTVKNVPPYDLIVS